MKAMPILSQSCRAKVVAEATWEIDALTEMALRVIMNDHEPEFDQLLVIRGALARINQLNGAIMSALNEDQVSTTQLQQKVFGVLPSSEAPVHVAG